MPASFYVRTNKNSALSEIVELRLIKLNYRWGAGTCSTNRNEIYGYVMWDDGTITYTTMDDFTARWGVHCTLEELFNTEKWLYDKYLLKLNKDYTAEITNEGIKVGCQTFSFIKFDELVELVNKFRSKIK